MEELLNLFVELYQGVSFSRFINEKKPFAKYVEEARRLNREEGQPLIDSIRESDWIHNEDGNIPAYILFKGRNHFSPYVLDNEFRFIKRLYNIQKPEGFKEDYSVLVGLNA